MKIREVIKNEYIYATIIKVLLVIVAFIESVLVVRYLGSHLNGQVAYIKSVASINTIIFAFGLHQAYPFYKRNEGSEYRNTFLNAAFLLVFIYIVIVVALCVGIGDITIRFILILIPVEVFAKYASYVTLIDYPLLRNKTEFLINIINIFILSFISFMLKPSIQIGVFLLASKNIMMILYYTNKLHFKICFNKQTFNLTTKLLKFGFIPMVSLLLSNLNYRLDILMLKNKVTDSQISVYSVGVSLAERCWLVTDTMRDIMTSKLANGKGVEELARISRFALAITSIIIFGIAVVGKKFIVIFYGIEYSSAYLITLLIAFGTLGMNYTKLVVAFNVVHGKQKKNLKYMLLGVMLNFIANYQLIPIYGIYGAAIASIISYTVIGVLFVRNLKKENDIKYKDVLLINKADIDMIVGRNKK